MAERVGYEPTGIWLSYNHFNSMHGARMNIGDFHDFALCNSFNSFA
jgi:hypothetical protein